MRQIVYTLLFFALTLNVKSQSLSSKEGALISTPYHFSVTIPKEWKLLSKQEIEEEKRKLNNTDLLMSSIAYLGDKKNFDDIPKLFVVFYPQSKIGEKGFLQSSKLILSSKVRDFVEKGMNKKFTEWSFKLNENEYNIDTAKRMIMFSSSTEYNDGKKGVVTYCYFLMKTGAAEINFSFQKPVMGNYENVMKKILRSVHIDEAFRLVKD